MRRFLLRTLLGGVLGFLVGENAIATGVIATPFFIPVLVWYTFLFLSFDYLIVKYNLSDRAFFVLASIFGIIIGGILDKEFSSLSSFVLNTFWWGASFVLVFNFVQSFIPRGKTIIGVWGFVIFLILTLLSFGSSLGSNLERVNRLGMILLLMAVAVLFFIFRKFLRSQKNDARPIIQKKPKVLAILGIFVVLSTVFGAEGYILLSAAVSVLTLFLLSRFKLIV